MNVAPEPITMLRGNVNKTMKPAVPPPLEAFFQAKEDEFAFAYTFEEDGDGDDDDSSSSASSGASSSYASARSEQTPEPVRDGAAVSFCPDPVVEIRVRPVTTPEERSELFYSPRDFKLFRREFRALVRAKRAAMRARQQQMDDDEQSQSQQPLESSSDYHWNPLSSFVGAIATAAWNAVPEVIVRAESVSRQQAGMAPSETGGVIPDRLFHHHGF